MGMASANYPLNPDDEEASVYAGQIVSLVSFPMAMHTAIQLRVFEIIAKAEAAGSKISAAEIAEQIGASDNEGASDKLERILRLLASFSVVSRSGERDGSVVYGLSAVGKYFAPDEDRASFGPMMSFIHDHVYLTTWSKLKECILEGGCPFTETHGKHLFDYSSSDPRFNTVLNSAMLNYTTIVMKKVLKHYTGFQNLNHLVDVGGGLGYTLKTIISKYPSLQGINFDLPHVIQHALPTQRIHHLGGDMFHSVPSPAEAIFMKWILHDWGDESCVKVLKNCYTALPEKGKVIVLEHVVGDDSESDDGVAARGVYQRDVSMMTNCPGGRERTRAQFIQLADAAGFTSVNFVCYVCNFWVIEFWK